MSSLKALRSRIKGINSTKKITKAMQLISAARMHRSREALYAARPYLEQMQELIDALRSKERSHAAQSESYLLIAVTSDRGLCGSFNASIVKKVSQYCSLLQSRGAGFNILCIGKRGYESLNSLFGSPRVSMLSSVKSADLRVAEFVVSKVLCEAPTAQLVRCVLFFNKFVSVIKHDIVQEEVDLFLDPAGYLSYECEPVLGKISGVALERYLVSKIYGAFLESAASEHSTRMTAMDSATRNAEETLRKLGSQYNRTRQSLITKELIEIISGAEVA